MNEKVMVEEESSVGGRRICASLGRVEGEAVRACQPFVFLAIVILIEAIQHRNKKLPVEWSYLR